MEVNFLNKTKDRGWRMFGIVYVVKMPEKERKIAPLKIVNVSVTRHRHFSDSNLSSASAKNQTSGVSCEAAYKVP